MTSWSIFARRTRSCASARSPSCSTKRGSRRVKRSAAWRNGAGTSARRSRTGGPPPHRERRRPRPLGRGRSRDRARAPGGHRHERDAHGEYDRRRAARPLAGARDPHAGPLLPRVPARGPHRRRDAPGHHPPARGRGDRAHVPSRRTRCRAALRLDLRTRARGRARDAHRSTRAPGTRGPPGRPDDLRRALMPRSAGLTSRERVRRALRGDAIDRPPFAVWRHFYSDENEGAERLAGTTIAFTTRHRLDIVKYNPRAHYHAEPWGTAYRYAGAARPTLVRYAVRRPDEWRKIGRKPVSAPAFRELLAGLRRVRRALPDVPLLATIFTPVGLP